jgi:thiamine pyrophosphokinase
MEEKSKTEALIFAGGQIDDDFARRFSAEHKQDFVAAVDAGLEACERAGLVPDLITGDFDTVNPAVLSAYRDRSGIRIEKYNPVKDKSDLELAVEKLGEAGFRKILVLGALGKRADHTLSNIRLICFCGKKNINVILLDSRNRISCHVPSAERGARNEIRISRKQQWGKYVSFFAVGKGITLTLQGFRYPLTGDILLPDASPSFAVSNEITGGEGTVLFEGQEGSSLIVMETSDTEKR